MSITDSTCAPVEEMLHGVLVHDPYRWLEDRSLPETEEWIREQQRRFDEYFAECEDLPAIRERIREYLDIEITDQPAKVRGRYFYRRRARGQEQSCIYTRDVKTRMERLLVDPTREGEFASAHIHQISADGSLLAYELKHGGEDQMSMHIVDVKSGDALPHSVTHGYSRGFAFTADNRGFYYCQESESDASEHAILLHLFDESIEDRVIFRAARSRRSRLILTADSVHLGATWIREVGDELAGEFWMAKQDEPEDWKQVFSDSVLSYGPILKNGRLFAVSYEDAPNGKLIECELTGKEKRIIIPDQGRILQRLLIVENMAYCSMVDGCASRIQRWTLQGIKQTDIALPKLGTVRLLSDRGDGSSIFVSYESFSQQPVIFEYVPATDSLQVWHERATTGSPALCETRYVSYPSVHGTVVPMTLVARQPLTMNTPVPVIMSSYGGFGAAMTPQHSVLIAILMECGAVFALPHVRGGGDFGKAWYDAGRRRNKGVAIQDFLAAALWLYQEGITSPEKMAIFGGSNSGLLVGAAMTQRPDLFRAVLCIAPLLDMVRYEHFRQAGKWKTEYGSAEIEQDFKSLYAYSPYHHVDSSLNYPAVLFVTGDKDERCDPAHVRKMAARLIENPQQRCPILVDYSAERGHSPTLPLNTRIHALSRRVAFLCRQLGLSFRTRGHHEATCA